jgi:hypothetical protein
MPSRLMEEWWYSSTFLGLSTWRTRAISFKPLPLYSQGRKPLVPIGQETGWTPELVWAMWRGEKYCTAGNWTQAAQPIGHRCNYWAIQTPTGKRKIKQVKLLLILPTFYFIAWKTGHNDILWDTEWSWPNSRDSEKVKTNSVAFSPQANYTEWPPLVDEI